MQPSTSAIELALQDLLEFKIEKISATESNLVVTKKLPYGNLITKTKITTIIRTGKIEKDFVAKAVSCGV